MFLVSLDIGFVNLQLARELGWPNTQLFANDLSLLRVGPELEEGWLEILDSPFLLEEI